MADRDRCHTSIHAFAWDRIRRQIYEDARLGDPTAHGTDPLCIEDSPPDAPHVYPPYMAAIVQASMEGGSTDSVSDDPFVDWLLPCWVSHAGLSSSEAAVLEAVYVGGLSREATATELQCSVRAVRNTLDSAIQKIRQVAGLPDDMGPVAWRRQRHPATLPPSKRKRRQDAAKRRRGGDRS